MDLAAFFLATLVAHVGFAIFVTAHAFLTDEDAGNWPYITLALGLAGVAGYFFYDELSESGRI
ncbi:hypothetical protein [Natronobacterium texcoconense]|uniref:Uncharacterized protein n=1 Tax=Natronobacterium texcoconense TaxID=1095778 RepID=A0A1H1INR9_NATTX|nr:hypothetical protein [Natronobacterium texcoconense]SDR39347.1 hypothetical protein SAMN04489842_3670 [Natronobacterium texcoconense]